MIGAWLPGFSTASPRGRVGTDRCGLLGVWLLCVWHTVGSWDNDTLACWFVSWFPAHGRLPGGVRWFFLVGGVVGCFWRVGVWWGCCLRTT